LPIRDAYPDLRFEGEVALTDVLVAARERNVEPANEELAFDLYVYPLQSRTTGQTKGP
jgi:hypothetical protein